ncbi:MAG: tRNA (guanosine(46)-N7)-methyltransferase TrmB [Actinobacteria bacterium]|nr:tRNA (guanosine(46)-N7)-methyltransferase TrmB [Actinomycetota bacterium]
MSSPPPYARSFRPRRRGLSPERAAIYRRLAPRWSLDVEGPLLDFEQVFGRAAPVVFDIGFGGGEGLIDMAEARLEECVIGVEIHTPGVAKVLDAVEAGGWNHVRLVEADALDFLPRVPFGSLAGVRIWFPDPWLKNKQQHRRLVRPQVVAALTDRLRVGGVLHVATDIDEYARHTEKVVAGEERLQGGAIPRPEWRPVTRFERRGLAAGRTPTDLWYERLP